MNIFFFNPLCWFIETHIPHWIGNSIFLSHIYLRLHNLTCPLVLLEEIKQCVM